MKIYTIKNGQVSNKAKVEKHVITGAGIEIPAILLGECGRGRTLGIIPVQLTPEQEREWKANGSVEIKFGDVGQSKSGRPKLIAKGEENDNKEKCLVVFLTQIGFRGGNSHTGDVIKDTDVLNFPGEILVEGTIAQGDAGRMGSGQQILAIMPPSIFRTSYYGRLYDAPNQHFYYWDGQNLIGGLTKEDRDTSDIF